MIRVLRDPYATSLPPELTGGGEVTPSSTDSPVPAGESVDASTDAYDPGDYTVDDVVAYAEAHPDEVDAILAAERDGKNRVTLISHLETMRDE